MSDEREDSTIARASRILADRLAEQAWGRGLGIAEERQRVTNLALARITQLENTGDPYDAAGADELRKFFEGGPA